MYADAETFLLRAVKLNPAYADAHYELGLLYEDRKQDAKAIHEYQLATKLRFDLSKAPCHPGRLYQKDGQPALAQKKFDAFEALKAKLLPPPLPWNDSRQDTVVRRREFLGACAAGLLVAEKPAYTESLQVHYRRPPPYQPYIPLMEPGHDEFPDEKAAMELAARLREWWAAQETRGEARFYVLPDNVVRFEIKSPGAYKTGLGKVRFEGDRISGITTIEEYVASAPRPLFRDVTDRVFESVLSFAEQLSRGVPYWTSRLDPATGIQIYGSDGIAVGDIDNDGVYVCQPGGLPNRLYKNVNGRFVDISAKAGIDLHDETSCALFLDLRNLGLQDVVVLRSGGPALFLNNGDGSFRLRGDAFAFQTLPQGSFTGMAAADYDRDGKLDLYLCCYSFFQTEAQYRYPAPYHDARNGPPSFLFRNCLDADGNGKFDDVTAESGLNQNNNRFSFAPAWCDY
ncbi:MAG: hypothetical protein DMG57_06530, partial [Acidobacteria bacterium]